MKRELFEETNIKGIELKELVSRLIHMPHGTVNMTIYHAIIPKDTDIVLAPEEHHAFAWFSLAGLLNEDNILWGIPSIIRDFGFLENLILTLHYLTEAR